MQPCIFRTIVDLYYFSVHMCRVQTLPNYIMQCTKIIALELTVVLIERKQIKAIHNIKLQQIEVVRTIKLQVHQNLK